MDFIKKIEKSDWKQAKKRLVLNYLNEYPEQKLDNSINKQYKIWSRSKAFQEYKENFVKRDDENLRVCNLMLVMLVTMALFFLRSVLVQDFLVNFSIDAIVGSVAIFFSVRNVIVKYRLLDEYGIRKDYLMMDVACLVVCILLKALIPINMDFSLVILVADFYASKKKFTKQALGALS